MPGKLKIPPACEVPSSVLSVPVPYLLVHPLNQIVREGGRRGKLCAVGVAVWIRLFWEVKAHAARNATERRRGGRHTEPLVASAHGCRLLSLVAPPARPSS